MSPRAEAGGLDAKADSGYEGRCTVQRAADAVQRVLDAVQPVLDAV